jgi:hypothetical protein
MHDAEAIHHCVLTALDTAFLATGESRYRVARALACARGRIGRPAHDDAAALQAMRAALAEGRAANPTHAARMALRDTGGQVSAADVQRLFRKHKQESCRA